MTKSELITIVADRASLTHVRAEMVVNTIFDSMTDALLAGGRIEIRGFGTLENGHYPPYLGRNPRTGKVIEIGAKVTPFFKTSINFKKTLNDL